VLVPVAYPFENIKTSHSQISPHPCLVLQPDSAEHAPTNSGASNGSYDDESHRSAIAAIHENLQGSYVVDDDGPADGRSRRRQVVLPNNQQYRKQLRARTDDERSRQGGGVGVIGYGGDATEPLERRQGAQQADGYVEGKRAQQAVDEEEQVLQEQWVRAEGAGRWGVIGLGSRLFNTSPCQVYIEEEKESSQAYD
jgi:hypothetical protein